MPNINLRDIGFLIVGIILTTSFVFGLNFFNKNNLNQIPTEKKDPTQPVFEIVSHSIYYANETGQVIVRLSDYLGNPLSGSCNTTIVFPNKTMWYVDYPLSPSSLAGNYYTSLTIPDVIGIYEYSFSCDVNFNSKQFLMKKSSSFQVSIAYQEFQAIMDKLDAMNSTLSNQTNYVNQSIMNRLDNLENEIISVNNTVIYSNSSISNLILSLNNTMNFRFDNLETSLATYFADVQTSIYNLQQRWLDGFNNLANEVSGAGESLNAIGSTLGIQGNTNCGIWDRAIGRC